MPDPDWITVLDELEQGLASGAVAGWTPPTGLGPLPADLAPRARTLVAAQRTVLESGRDELQRIAGELSRLRPSSLPRLEEPAAYIDTVA